MNFRSLFGPSQDAHIDGEFLSAYLDGQVKPDELRRVETHLGTCPACQSELASLRQTVTMLHALPRVPVPRAFTLSEAQVGLRRPAPAGGPTWFGGLARGLVAVSAVALVAVMAATLLRQPSWQPSQNIAQLAAPAPVAETPAASAPASATTADAVIARVEPTDTAKAPKAAAASGAPVTAQAPQAQAATKAPAPAAAPLAAGTQIAKLPEKPAEKPVTAIAEAQPPAAKAPANQPAALSAAAAVPATPPPTDRPAAAPAALAAAVAPTATLAAARAASEPGLAAAAARSGVTSTAVTTTTLSELPAEASLVYADARGLWALDRTTGVRPLVQAEGVTAPVISGDRAWVAYRQVKGNNSEVWAVPSSGGDARLLLAERDLIAGLPQGYRERRIQDVGWLPGKRVLVVTTLLTPVAQDAAPQLEMWTVDTASGTRKLLASGDARQRPSIAPNGAQIAFFRREPEKAGEGGLWLIGADGGGERAALRFPARPDARSFDGQIAWLPDSSGLWAAIPDAQQPNALALYRVPLNGEAQPAGRVEGSEAFWSPNGARLAYTRLTGDATGPREIYLAAADGTNPQLFATIPNGRFIGWSPDSARFIYEDGGQLFVGAPGGKPQRLAAGASEPRWLGPSQIVYQAGQGDTRQLIIQAVDGKAVPLQTLPAGATVDSIRP